MKTPKYSMVPAAAGLLAFLMSSATATSMAQTHPDSAKMPRHQENQHRGEMMQGTMGGPHHVLAMAYRDNLVTFARALQKQVTQSKTVNLDLARPAATEMRRSFDQMKEHHQAQATMMGSHADSAMSDMKQHMVSHLTAVGEHLTALESELNASVPDPTAVSKHTAGILKECEGMSAMPAKAKPHQMD